MPGLVKIGLSSLLPEDRARKGFTTFVPSPFEVLFRAVTSRRAELEKAVHNLLAGMGQSHADGDTLEVSVR
ncbi:MAG: GIY-YIG nuclease family protein [Pseudonocardiaceae bacterium]